MRRRYQPEFVWHDPRSANQYIWPGAGRIRRHLLEHAIDGMDYYGEAFRALRLRGDEAILNVGTGDGLDEVRLATEFNHYGRIVGIDIPLAGRDFDDNFEVAQTELVKAGKYNVTFKQGNAMKLNFSDNNFDVVIWAHSGYHFVDLWQAILETRRVLKPGGKLLNLTNGDINKHGHHGIVSDIKAELGVSQHEPFSATFNLQTSRRVLKHLIGPQLVPITQNSLYRIDHDSLPDLENSIDTYRSTVPEEAVNDYIPARRQLIEERVVPYIEHGGGWYDYVYRGGGVYENANVRTIVHAYLGRSALART